MNASKTDISPNAENRLTKSKNIRKGGGFYPPPKSLFVGVSAPFYAFNAVRRALRFTKPPHFRPRHSLTPRAAKGGSRYPHTLLALNHSVSFNSVVLLEHHSFTSAEEAS